MNLSANKKNVTPLAKAMKLLARRDHSVRELQQKLKPYYPAHEIENVIERCLQENWLNDTRFAESYIRSRSLVVMGRCVLHWSCSKKVLKRKSFG